MISKTSVLSSSRPWWQYVVVAVGLLWLCLSVFLGYRYLLFASQPDGGRGGTFVEAIDDSVSYLPYRGMKANDLYYQSLLFSSCLDYEEEKYVSDWCHVTTEDNKVYTVRVQPDIYWSDGSPVSLEDIYFSYNEVVRNNIWGISYLDVYNAISVTQTSQDEIQIEFPFATVDNMNFFTQYILPEKIVSSMNLQEYKTDFARDPLYGNCARLVDTQDEQSLVISLEGCPFSNILYYQLKSFEEEAFAAALSQGDDSIITMYSQNDPVSGYSPYSVRTDTYMTLFFNEESERLTNSIRRAIGGLLYEQFYNDSIQEVLVRDHLLFDSFWSDGSNLEDHIVNNNPRLDVTRAGLERIDIQALPESLAFSGEQRKNQIFFLDAFPGNGETVVTLRTDIEYDRILIAREGTTNAQTIYPTDDGSYLRRLSQEVGVEEGLNKYSIKGYREDKISTLMILDLYYLNLPGGSEDMAQEYVQQRGAIKVIYFDDYASNALIQRLQEVFEQVNVDRYFHFVPYDVVEEFDAKLLSRDYDLVLSPFDFARRKDISSFLLTDVPTINPSLYTNPQLASFVSDYVHQTDVLKETLRAQINDIYANDMPFFLLGQTVEPYYIKERFAVLDTEMRYSIGEFKQALLENIELVQHVRLRKDRFLSVEVLDDFVDELFAPLLRQ